MLEFNQGKTEKDLVTRMQELRNPTEPEEPTEEPGPVDVSEEADTLEPEEELEQSESEEEAEASEPLEAEESNEESQELVYEIDGEEITLSEIQKWRKGHMQEADYTQKSQVNADLRKTLEAESTKLMEKSQGLQDLIDILEGNINEDISDEQLQQLLDDDDTGEYLRQTEKRKGRLAKLDQAKTARNKLQTEQLTTRQKQGNDELIKLNPSWLENGQTTKSFKSDQDLLGKYAADKGFTQDELQAVLTSGRVMQAMIDAAKFDSKVSKAPAVERKVRKAPTIVKGKQRQVSSLEKQFQDAQAKLKKTGHIEDALAVKKLKRQLTG